MNYSHIAKLDKQVTSAIFAIKIGSKTPEEAGIGRLLNALQKADEAAYEIQLAKYKQVLADKESQKNAK